VAGGATTLVIAYRSAGCGAILPGGAMATGLARFDARHCAPAAAAIEPEPATSGIPFQVL
jgi:hypothetical protein